MRNIKQKKLSRYSTRRLNKMVKKKECGKALDDNHPSKKELLKSIDETDSWIKKMKC